LHSAHSLLSSINSLGVFLAPIIVGPAGGTGKDAADISASNPDLRLSISSGAGVLISQHCISPMDAIATRMASTGGCRLPLFVLSHRGCLAS
jgi:hypothetical protein